MFGSKIHVKMRIPCGYLSSTGTSGNKKLYLHPHFPAKSQFWAAVMLCNQRTAAKTVKMCLRAKKTQLSFPPIISSLALTERYIREMGFLSFFHSSIHSFFLYWSLAVLRVPVLRGYKRKNHTSHWTKQFLRFFLVFWTGWTFHSSFFISILIFFKFN